MLSRAPRSTPPSIRIRPLALLLALGLGTTACTSELPPVREESEHVRLRSHESWFCEGTVGWLEHHYTALSDFLGVELPEGDKVDMVVVADPAELASICGSPGVGVDGCAAGSDAFALAPYHPHELVHAYASLLGDPPFFFQEGLAEVVGCGEKNPGPKASRPSDLRPILTTAGFRGLPADELAAAYAVAAELTRYVLDVYGREAYLAFYAALGRNASVAAIDAAMRTHLGASLDAVLEGYAASPPRSSIETCLRIAECATPEVEPSGATLACGVGVHPFSMIFPNLSALVRSIPGVTGEGLRFRGEGLPALGGLLASCDGALEASPRFVSLEAGAAFEVWTNPPPGDYTVVVWKSPVSSDPDEGALFLERVPSPGGATCGGAASRLVPKGTAEITVVGDLGWSTVAALPSGLSRAVFSFELEEDVLAGPLVSERSEGEPPLEGDTAWICAGGCPEDPGATCEEVDLDPVVSYEPFLFELGAGEPLHLVVDGTPGDEGYRFGLELFPRVP